MEDDSEDMEPKMIEFIENDEEGTSVTGICQGFPPPLREGSAVSALITDLFDWLEREWRLPLVEAEQERPPLPLPIVLTQEVYTAPELMREFGLPGGVRRWLQKYEIKPIGYGTCRGRRAAQYRKEDLVPLLKQEGVSIALSEEMYTVEELISQYGLSESLRKRVRKQGLVPCGSTESRGKPLAFYRKEDLAPLILHWECYRLIQVLNEWWVRFFPPACQACTTCRQEMRNPLIQRLLCKEATVNRLRYVVAQFVEEVARLGGVTVWWRERRMDVWEREEHHAWGVVFIYLLDRHWLHLSIKDLLRIKPLCTMANQERTRLWRSRRPEEYQQFLCALQATNYKEEIQEYVLKILSLLVLLRYGLAGLVELGRPLSESEVQEAGRSRRLVLPHLGHGMFLPYPLSHDIRVGHVVLDEIRYYIWEYAVHQTPVRKKFQRDEGPRHWDPGMVSAIEQALAAPVYIGLEGILSRRCETEHALVNPWRVHQKGRQTDTGYALLPSVVQDHMMAYITFCQKAQGIEFSTLQARAEVLMRFFTWARTQGVLTDYPYWSREAAVQTFRTYASTKCAEMAVSTRYEQFRSLVTFFATLVDLEYVVPSGWNLLINLAKGRTWEPRLLPREELLDRVFHDGVCQLSYDPFARLALTIQYYCGTRVTETCDLHLFCILEDQQRHAYLLVPRGKTKQERPFPIVSVGMERFLEYMDQIVSLRLSSEGKSRTLGQTNLRYLKDDPERALDWHYLFDRVPSASGRRRKARGRLSVERVEVAFQEALLFAVKANPDGFIVPETYSPLCQMRRPKGMECRYFAARDGITICPRCGSRLSGHRGGYCHHILEEDFVCDGEALEGEVFCPKCDAPLGSFLPITTHLFRHNSVSRAHRAGVSVPQNMRLHGHQTIPMHLRYLHLYLEDTTQEIRRLFAEKRLEEVRQALAAPTGMVVEDGIASTLSLEQYLGVTLRRTLKRRTCGIWGGFWAGALAQQGVGSPVSIEEEIVILEESYEHAVAQYWYEALGLAVSEVAFEFVADTQWCAQVPAFLEREKITALVQLYLRVVQDSLGSPLGRRLMETEIMEQRRFLHDLAEKLRPWWQHLGTIDPLVELFAPRGGHAFQKRIAAPQAPSGEAD